MDFILLAAVNLAAVTSMMLIGWLVSLVVRNVTFVDSLWGMGFVFISWITLLSTDGYPVRQLLIVTLATVWGTRLCLHLSWRNWGRGEDPRYAAWRERAGGRFWVVSLVKVFLLQALFLWAISLPLQFGQTSSSPGRFTVFDAVGLILWSVGFFFEAVADFQLARFKADPASKGKVMSSGLWAYCRHPNYFGEFLIWWGFYFIALSVPGGWWTIASPLIITAVLLKMTGIPLMERTIVESRPGYREYMRRTNAFFPWPPKKEVK